MEPRKSVRQSTVPAWSPRTVSWMPLDILRLAFTRLAALRKSSFSACSSAAVSGGNRADALPMLSAVGGSTTSPVPDGSQLDGVSLPPCPQ